MRSALGLIVVLAAAASTVAAVSAQPVPGPGPRASGPGMAGRAMGGPGMMRWGADRTPGWARMTPEERSAHQQAMREVKTQSECRAVVDKHRATMLERARAQGHEMPTQPRHDPCAGLPN